MYYIKMEVTAVGFYINNVRMRVEKPRGYLSMCVLNVWRCLMGCEWSEWSLKVLRHDQGGVFPRLCLLLFRLVQAN